MTKYFTIVIKADDEKAARQLVPGENIGPNKIVACALGDILSLKEQIETLIPDDKQHELSEMEHKKLLPFL